MKKVSLLLVVSLCLSFCSCSKNVEIPKREQDYITDGEWYSNTLNYTTRIEGVGGSMTLTQGEVIFSDSNRLITYSENYINGEDELTGDHDDIAYLTEYTINDNGEDAIVASRFDLMAEGFVYSSPDYSDVSTVKTLIYSDDKVYALIEEYHYNWSNYEDSTSRVYIQEFNLATDTLGRTIENDSISGMFDPLGNGYVIRTWSYDSDIYFFVRNMDQYSILALNDDFEVVDEFELDSISDGETIEYAYIIENNCLVLVAWDYLFDTYTYLKVDINSETVIELDDFEMSDHWENTGDSILSTDTYGVYRLNVDTGDSEMIMDFNNCNINRTTASATTPVYFDNDTIILMSHCGDNCNEIWRFTREESNPNVGKAIIRVADLDGQIDTAVADAIYEFNETSDSAYMLLDDRYVVDNYMTVDASVSESYGYRVSDEYISMRRDAERNVTNQMRVDIISGNGPDIILDAFEYSDFNNENCMLDLRNLVIDGSTEYINAISSGSEPLYQFPLELHPSAVMWTSDISEYVNEDGYTISYENYAELVDAKGFGDDRVSESMGRIDYFIELFNYNFDRFVSGRRVNVDTEEFRGMAEFVMSRSVECTYDEYDHSSHNSYWREEVYFSELDDYNPCCLPGVEGIMLRCRSSVGISSACPDVDDAVAFVKLLISEYEEYLVPEIIHSSSVDTIEYWNNRSIQDSEMYGYPADITDVSVADTYTDLMVNAIGIYTYDADINIILYEEMQPYFAGDKTLDEVISIIEDRISTVLSER